MKKYTAQEWHRQTFLKYIKKTLSAFRKKIDLGSLYNKFKCIYLLHYIKMYALKNIKNIL